MTYNLTSINASGGFLTFTQGVNTVLLGGWLGTMVLIGIAAVAFMSTIFTTNDPKKAMIVTSFSCFALSLPLRGLDLVSNLAIYVSMIALALTLAATRNKD